MIINNKNIYEESNKAENGKMIKKKISKRANRFSNFYFFCISAELDFFLLLLLLFKYQN